MPARIGFDGTPLKEQRSGVGYYTERLLSALLEVNASWDYLLYSNRPLGELDTRLQKAIQVRNYLSPSRWLWMQLVLPRAIQQTQPDLCHFTNASAPLWQTKPYVLTIYDASLYLWHQYHPWSRLLAIRTMLPFLARRADAVITISQYARNDLIRILDLPPAKVHVVYGAAPADFKPIREERKLAALRCQYGLPEKYILYVGTLEPRKNLTRLIHSFRKLHRHHPDVKLVLVGPSGWMMGGFRQEIARLGLEDAVHYLGYVPTADLLGIFSMATVFAFPSLYEGFGLPPLEAMACGTPVLTSRNTAMAEVCADAAHLVNPENKDEIADALQQLLTDAEWRAELSQRGLERASLFSWERAARETTAVYKQVLQND